MRWPVRSTLGILGLILLAVCYLSVRHYHREAVSITSIHPETFVRNSKNSSTHLDVGQIPQEKKLLSAAIPFGSSNANLKDLSNFSAEGRTVRVALKMIEDGDFKKARDLLLPTIATTNRGNNYLRYGKPSRISIRKEVTYTGKDQIQFENWVYENGRGRILRELEFLVKPGEGQIGDHGPDNPNAGASALWVYAYSFYSEGGMENVQKAKETFEDFIALFANGPEDLVQAAQIDIAVICIELMRSAPTLGYRIGAAAEAAQVLKNFLLRWPNCPRAYDASIALKNVQDFLFNPR
jgi:hypothetical protein